MKNIHAKIQDYFKNTLKLDVHIIFISITGSTAYGMNRKDSDIDVMGVFIPPIEYILGIKYIEQIQLNKSTFGFEGMMYSFQKWYKLIVQQNPNILESLWHEDNMYVYKDNHYFNLLIDHRDQLLSKKLKHSYVGYAWAQLQRVTKLNEKVNQNSKRLENFDNFGYDTKAASHIFRLLNTGLDALVEEKLTVLRPERQFLIAIREGKYTYDELVKMANEKEQLVTKAYIESKLRNQIDEKMSNKLQYDILMDYIMLNK